MSDNSCSHDHGIADRNVARAFWLNLVFTIIELVGGVLTNSVAIQSDALHDAGDTLSLGLAWYFQKLGHKQSDKAHTYGYKRFNTLGALITGTVLVTGSIVIIYRSVSRLLVPEEVHASGMIWLAILGVVVNSAAAIPIIRSGTSLNEKMISWHLVEDVISWVVVLVGSILLYYFDINWLDPVMSLLIAVYIMYHVYGHLSTAIRIILQMVPDGISIDEVKAYLESHPQIDNASEIKVWSLDGEVHVLTAKCHMSTDTLPASELTTLRSQLESDLAVRYQITDSTLEWIYVN